MISKDIFRQQVGKIKRAFPRFKVSQDKKALTEWYEKIQQMDEQEFTKAVDRIIKHSKYPPTLSDIITMTNAAGSQYFNVNEIAERETIKRVTAYLKDNGAYTEQHRLDIKGGKFPDLAEEV